MKTLTNHNIGKLHCELIRRQTIGEDWETPIPCLDFTQLIVDIGLKLNSGRWIMREKWVNHKYISFNWWKSKIVRFPLTSGSQLSFFVLYYLIGSSQGLFKLDALTNYSDVQNHCNFDFKKNCMIGRSHLILTRKTAEPRFSSSFFLDWYNCQFSPLKKISYLLFQNYLLFTKTNALQATLLKSSNLPVWWYATIRASETRGVLQQTSKNHPWKLAKELLN